MDKLNIKLQSLWKAIDEVLQVNPNDFNETKRNKYFTLKSMLLKESEYLRSISDVPDYTANLLTEDLKINRKILLNELDNILLNLAKENDEVSSELSDVSDLTKMKKAKLEALVVGDILEVLFKKKETPDNLGYIVSSQLVEGLIDNIVELVEDSNK